jgi:hypothetical protein
MVQKTDNEFPKVEYWHKNKKLPVISCVKYDEEERKSIFGDKAIPEPFSGFFDE